MTVWECTTRIKEGVIICQRVTIDGDCVGYYSCPAFDVEDYDTHYAHSYNTLEGLLSARTFTGKRLIHPIVEEQLYRMETHE